MYLQVKSTGQTLFDAVVAKLRLVESDYFDLEYTDSESIPVSSHYWEAPGRLGLCMFVMLNRSVASYACRRRVTLLKVFR
jgi:hypothetical protein